MSDLYQKIPGLYKREEQKPFNLIEGIYREPELELLKNIEWTFTEKVDGTNIRIIWDGHNVVFGGRTENAQIPSPLVTKLNGLFMGTRMEQVFEQVFGETKAILFGEGYGAKIQKGGGNYSNTQEFVLFDVIVDGWYLRRKDVDGTLRCNCTDTCHEPNQRIVDMFNTEASFKNTDMYVWSGGGAAYALRFARLFGLKVKESHCISKFGAPSMDRVVDDIQETALGDQNYIINEKRASHV